MSNLNWTYRLFDRVSGPAGRIERSLTGILDRVSQFPAAVAVAQQGLQMLFNGASKIASLAFDAGKFALGALAFKESTLASFELMLGTKQQAKEFFDLAKGFGKLTPFETEDVVASFQNLLQAGFTEVEVPIVFQALGDVAAGKGFDKQVIDRLTLAFGQIRSKGKLMGDDLKQVVEAGVGRGAIFENIAKQLGIDAKSVDDVMSKGRVSADVAITAMLDTIRDKFSGGKELGQGMLNQATTIRGLLSTLSSAPMDLFLDLDMDRSRGFQGIKSFIENLTDALNPDSTTGDRLKGVISGVLDDVGGFLSGFTGEAMAAGFERLVSFITLGIDGVVAFKDGMMAVLQPTIDLMGTMEGGSRAGEGFRIFMAGLGVVLGAVLNVIALAAIGVGGLVDWLGKLGDYLSGGTVLNDMKSFGVDIAKGLASGILSALGIPVDAILKLGSSLVDAAKGALDIHSPSRVFKALGEYTAEGFAAGVQQGANDVDAAINRMVPTPVVARARGGGAPASVTVNITVNSGRDDGETIARTLADLLPSQLASMFEQLAIEDGAA